MWAYFLNWNRSGERRSLTLVYFHGWVSIIRFREDMKIGYVRVSKQEQHEALQVDALKDAGCEKWFLAKITGSKAERKGLDEARAYLRPGDTLVVWKLDRAGRSLTHLIDLLRNLKERGIEFINLR